MRRRSRIFAAWIAFAALLFAQLAIAAYACERFTPVPAAVVMPDCDMPMNANLCDRHCDYGSTSLDSQKAKAAPDMAAVSVRIALPPPFASSVRAALPERVATGPPPTRFTVLRI